MKKFSKILIFALIAVMIFGAVQISAYEPYDTYTYSIDGEPLKSPKAYSADAVVDALQMGVGNISNIPTLNTASDIVTDNEANVYIVDKGNNRIVILDKYYSAKAVISEYVDENGALQTFNQPQGVFVTNPELMSDGSSHIYVCDTANFRVVVFDRDYNYVKTIDRPESAILAQDAFKPCAIAVDIYGRIFITSTATYEGVIVLSNEGDFTGFIGVQKVTYSLMDMIWRRFQSREERQTAAKNLAIPYNNITVDNEGFVYVTTNTNDLEELGNQYSSIRSKSASYSPVKKLNSAGTEIMKRNGFFDPGGEVAVMFPTDVSQIIDVAVGKEGSWTLLDKKRSRMFTYDQNGNLLFAFGDMGDQLGNGEDFVAMTYQIINDVYYLLLLDNSTSGYRITVYSPTPYYDTIISALKNQNDHNYSESIFYWQDLLTQNNNFDLAYIGIGKALFSQGKYEEAQEMLSAAYETDYHDKAFVEIRKAIIQKYLLWIVLAVIAVIVLVLKDLT